MKEYKITETLIYYIEADNVDDARDIANNLDKADAKRHHIDIEINESER